MHAWTKSGNPLEHPSPWGRYGVFSTIRVLPGHKILFKDQHLQRIRQHADKLALPWGPSLEELNTRVEKYAKDLPADRDHLLRVCLFEDCLGLSARLAQSDGNPVEGWLLEYRRPEPTIKCTAEKDLYGKLVELEIEREDWIIMDPKDQELRETATSNLIFATDKNLLIPEKKILHGITLQNLMPYLKKDFTISTVIPNDQNILEFNEILLCGTGRGIAPLEKIPELGWSKKSDDNFSKIRSLYEKMISSPNACLSL
jgi:branched-subunit amino acid aminotransferase/4-amino-4-deoxychorismate lyase